MYNTADVPNASDGVYDWGDNPYPGNYGSMQVHNHDAGQVIFAFNGWGGYGGIADLGIGTRAAGEPDWTFARNASSYVLKRLQVFVLPTPRIKQVYSEMPAQFSLVWDALPGASYSIYKLPILDATNWTRVGELIATSNAVIFTDTNINSPAGFFRISVP